MSFWAEFKDWLYMGLCLARIIVALTWWFGL
jgi:hypothetical protein